MSKQKKTLLIFSQCFVYGGSERLMQSIYKSKYLNENYNVIFSYSYFKDYKKGIERDCAEQEIVAKIQPLYLLTNGDVFNKIDLQFKSKSMRYFLKSPLFFIEFFKIYALWNYIYLFVYMFKIKPEVLHINNGGYPAAISCNQLAKVSLFFNKTRVIYQSNGKAIFNKNRYNRFFDYLINKSVDIFLTHSKQNRESLIERGFNPSKIVSVPSYFNETVLNSTTNIVKKNEFTLCMVGFLTYRKGQLFLLKALLCIKNKNPSLYSKIHLNIIGNGSEFHTLKTFIEENNMTQIVTLWGERADYINFIINCDIFLIPSVAGEDLPLVLLSAMQYKKCIIASEFSGIGEQLSNGYNGLLVQPNINTISDELCDAIIKLCLDNELRKKLSINVFESFNQNLGENRYVDNLNRIYKNLS